MYYVGVATANVNFSSDLSAVVTDSLDTTVTFRLGIFSAFVSLDSDAKRQSASGLVSFSTALSNR